MRTKKDYVSISITRDLHKILLMDRGEFEKLIGGGKWSISDTIKEYHKIMRSNLNPTQQKVYDKRVRECLQLN